MLPIPTMRTKLYPIIALLMISGTLIAQNSDSLRQVISAMHFDLPVLSPVPETVSGVKDSRISLNGTWKFSPESGEILKASEIEVPGEWEMQGFKVPKGKTGAYWKTFAIPKDWEGNRIKIRFDGISSFGRVKINGKPVGEHEGSFVAFELDITDAVKTGENILEVDVQCETVSDLLACTSQYAAHPVGGILRKVTLFTVPPDHITDFSWIVKFDAQYHDASVNVTTKVDIGNNPVSGIFLKFTLRDGNGHSVPLNQDTFEVPVDKPISALKSTFIVKSPQKWDPEHPNLYFLSTSLVNSGKVLQTISQKIGFRQIELRGNRFFVNNYPIKLRGINRHEVHPLRGRSLTPELCRRDVELFRAGNCNYIRTSHYPPSEEFLEACDEFGMFVESESSLCWIDHGASPVWKSWNYLDPQFLPYLVRANLENILSGRQHPSVIIWSLGNESRWSPLWERVLAEDKKLDPSRPTSFHDQCWGDYNNAKSTADLANYHYPELNGPRESDKEKLRPTFFGEYMHVQCYARRELETDPSVRSDAYANTLKQMVDSVYLHPACLGGAIWSGVDDIFHLSKDKICGYGPWGPIDGWRREKPEYTGMKKSYAPVIITNLQTAKAVNDKIRLDLENRYNFTNLSELKIEARIGNRFFPVQVSLAPLSRGSVDIDLSESGKADSLLLIFNDPRGFICQEELIHKGKPANLSAAAMKVNLKLAEEKDNFVIDTGKLIFKVAKINGTISCFTSKGDEIVSNGGEMMLVPFNDDDGGAPGVAANNYTQDIQPLIYRPDSSFRMVSLICRKKSDGTIHVNLSGIQRNKLEGTQDYIFNTNGTVTIGYDYVALTGFTGKNLLRQFGLLFTLPESFNRLSWERKGLWTTYPDWDINRLKGVADALPVNRKYVETPREIPACDWKDNSNRLGTNDFRSTKDHILYASLKNENGQEIRVQSDGSQNVRAWVDGGPIRLLVAGLNGPGSCRFFTGPRPEFKKGEHLKGGFTLVFQ